jgi:NAD(P)-dependent dehydrogenase (short-subunit alcohol dehydrogenase family)
VNNAGLMSQKRIETDMGIELTFAVNHLGYFITTNLLLDLITQTSDSRIINVASDLHFNGHINFNNLMHKNDYHGFQAYCDSKLANVLFTYKLAQLLRTSGTTTNTLHPGVVKTKFSIEDRDSKLTFPMGRISPDEGAAAQVYLSTAAEVKNISGRYFNQMRMEKSSVVSYDENLADTLWQKSLEFMHLGRSHRASQVLACADE